VSLQQIFLLIQQEEEFFYQLTILGAYGPLAQLSSPKAKTSQTKSTQIKQMLEVLNVVAHAFLPPPLNVQSRAKVPF
jgi:hypothetical protein